MPCSLTGLLGASGGALAADQSAALEEIVVTAERREQTLLEVPLSITAFGDDLRDRVGISSIQDMANFAPGVSYNMNTDRPSIRGIGRQSNFFSLDSPVANYIDGVYTSSVQDAQRRPIFIERTEILRGPQGALSGRGSIAGAINTISKRPSDAFGAEVRAYGADYARYGVEGTVTGPIFDWLRARVNYGTYHQDEGYFENVASGLSEGDQPNNRDIVDVMFNMNFGDSVDVFLKAAFADYDESRRTGFTELPFVAGVLNAPSAYGPGSNALTPLASFGYFPASAGTRLGTNTGNPAVTTGDVRNFSNDFRSNQQLDDHHNYTAHFTWHTGPVDVKWIGGHQNYVYTQFTDFDGTDVLTMRLPTGRIVSPGTTNMYREEREWYSNELNLTSTGDGPFSWIFGLYQSNEDYNQEPQTTTLKGYDELNTPFASIDTFLRAIGAPFNPAGIRTVVPNASPYTSVRGLIDGDTVSRAAFGQIDYAFSDQWSATLGVRYNEDKKEVTESLRYIANGLGNQLGNLLAGGAPVPGLPAGPRAVDVTPVPVPGAPLPDGVIRDRGIDPATGYRIRDMENTWDAVTGSVGLDYTPNDNNLIYVRAARGYRPGGFNAGFLYDPPMVDEETVDSYELGYKTTLSERLQLSTSVFYYDYQDIQLPLPTLGRCTDPNDLSTCTTLNSFVNLPTAESMGVEIEATGRRRTVEPVRDLRISRRVDQGVGWHGIPESGRPRCRAAKRQSS